MNDSIELLKQVLAVSQPPVELVGEFFSISANSRIREISDDKWSWPSDQYLWMRPRDGIGGIDVEIDHIAFDELDFIKSNMLARKADSEAAEEMMARASDGVRYALRLSAFQSAMMYVSLWTIAATLATAADGYVYTTDADWVSPMVPLSGGVLRSVLVTEKYRIQTGFQNDVEQAQKEMSEHLRR